MLDTGLYTEEDKILFPLTKIMPYRKLRRRVAPPRVPRRRGGALRGQKCICAYPPGHPLYVPPGLRPVPPLPPLYPPGHPLNYLPRHSDINLPMNFRVPMYKPRAPSNIKTLRGIKRPPIKSPGAVSIRYKAPIEPYTAEFRDPPISVNPVISRSILIPGLTLPTSTGRVKPLPPVPPLPPLYPLPANILPSNIAAPITLPSVSGATVTLPSIGKGRGGGAPNNSLSRDWIRRNTQYMQYYYPSLYGGRKKAANRNPWVNFIKRFAKKHGMNYSEAMQCPMAKRAYRRK